jgi:PAS domain S-box-containing protein
MRTGTAKDLFSRQVDELFRFAASAVAFSYIGSVITLLVFYDTGDFGRGLYWFAYSTLVMLFRGGVVWRHISHSESHSPRFWSRLMIAGNFLAGIQWGLLGTVLYPSEPGYRELYSVMVIIAYVAGSIVAFSSVRWAHEALSIPAALPAAIYIPFFAAAKMHIWAGVMSLFFVCTVLYFSRKQHLLERSRLQTEMENEQLLDQISEANGQLGMRNEELRFRAEVVSRAQLEARRRANMLSTHVERTLLPVIECDREFAIVDWNEAARLTFGYSLVDVRGLNLGELLFLPERQGNIKPFVAKLFRDNQPTTVDQFAVTRTGQRIPARFYVTPVVGEDGTPLRIAVIVTEAYGDLDRARGRHQSA